MPTVSMRKGTNGKQTQWMVKFTEKKKMNWNRKNCKTPYGMRNPSSTQREKKTTETSIES